jgi:thiamine-monophosphate kinase
MQSSTNNNGEILNEFELIARLSKLDSAKILEENNTVLTGIGDDAAVVSTPANQMLLTTDAIVDGVHFRSVDERWFDVGWKCAVSNLSDIAAMGGVPDHALVTLGVPPEASVETYADLYNGMNAAFSEFGGSIVGGDVVSSSTMFVNLALTGHPSSDSFGELRTMRRTEARAGDLVCVTGPLGSSAGGLEALLNGDTNPSSTILIDRHYRPTPQIEIGKKLVASGVRCAMDISDGLVGDLQKIAKLSTVNITVEMANIPLATELIFMFGSSAIELALSGGEDYELAFTAPKPLVDDLVANNIGLTVIGSVTSSESPDGQVDVIDENGEMYEPIRKGWDHLNG